MARRQLVALGHSPPQAGAAGAQGALVLGCAAKSHAACGSRGPRWGSGWPARSCAHLPGPTPGACSGRVGPPQPGGKRALCLSIPPFPTSQGYWGVHGDTH